MLQMLSNSLSEKEKKEKRCILKLKFASDVDGVTLQHALNVKLDMDKKTFVDTPGLDGWKVSIPKHLQTST